MKGMYPKTSVYHNESSSFDRFFDTGSTKGMFYVTKALQTLFITVAAEITADDIPEDIGTLNKQKAFSGTAKLCEVR